MVSIVSLLQKSVSLERNMKLKENSYTNLFRIYLEIIVLSLHSKLSV